MKSTTCMPTEMGSKQTLFVIKTPMQKKTQFAKADASDIFRPTTIKP